MIQTTHLVGLTSLIRVVPKATYFHDMPTVRKKKPLRRFVSLIVPFAVQLMPLLLRGLNLPDNGIRAGVIDTLIATTDPNNKENELISKYAGSLVTVMLKNSKAEDMPSPVCEDVEFNQLGAS